MERGHTAFSHNSRAHVCGCSGEKLAVIPKDLSASLPFPLKSSCLDSGELGFPGSLNTQPGIFLDRKLKINVPRTVPVGSDSWPVLHHNDTCHLGVQKRETLKCQFISYNNSPKDSTQPTHSRLVRGESLSLQRKAEPGTHARRGGGPYTIERNGKMMRALNSCLWKVPRETLGENNRAI